MDIPKQKNVLYLLYIHLLFYLIRIVKTFLESCWLNFIVILEALVYYAVELCIDLYTLIYINHLSNICLTDKTDKWLTPWRLNLYAIMIKN